MSQYASHFVDPVFKKKKQAELFETAEAARMAHLPIKAARNNDSTSVFHGWRFLLMVFNDLLIKILFR